MYFRPTQAQLSGNGPKRREMHRLGYRYVFFCFFLQFFLLTTNILYILGVILRNTKKNATKASAGQRRPNKGPYDG